MIPRILCRACGNEIQSSDKFCGNCGEKVEWSSIPDLPQPLVDQAPSPNTLKASSIVCPVCGNNNSAQAETCQGCGAVLEGSGKHSLPVKKKQSGLKGPPTKALQSWKLTVGFAVILIAVLVILKSTREEESHNHPPTGPAQNLSPNAASMLKEIESIQKLVDANPNDQQATLRLANLLHDVKFLPRAVMMYERYLEMNPSDPDGRVDLGITYFELSLTDSVKHDEYSAAAEREMEKALTYAPKHQLAHFNLGIVTLHAGDMSKAVEWFKKCIEIDPKSETGRRAQQFVNQHSFNTPSQ